MVLVMSFIILLVGSVVVLSVLLYLILCKEQEQQIDSSSNDSLIFIFDTNHALNDLSNNSYRYDHQFKLNNADYYSEFLDGIISFQKILAEYFPSEEKNPYYFYLAHSTYHPDIPYLRILDTKLVNIPKADLDRILALNAHCEEHYSKLVEYNTNLENMYRDYRLAEMERLSGES